MTEQELMDAGFVDVCEESEVGAPLPKRVEVAGRGVLLGRDGDRVHAFDEICPHENQLMRFAVVFGGEVTCPHHQYRFKLDTGRCNRRCAPLELFDVEVLDGRVWVRTSQDEWRDE